jgi:cell division protein ZapA
MEQITLNILGREYRIACRAEERAELLACAQYVDQKMLAIRDGGKILGADRVAVMAALQIAQELFHARGAGGTDVTELRRRVSQLTAQVDAVLTPQESLF